MWISEVLLLLLIAIIIANFKSLPFAWMMSLAVEVVPRLGRKSWQDRRVGQGTGREMENPLFQSVEFKSLCTLTEMDHNMHKSNSTFFADVDISRAKTLFGLIAPALFRRDKLNLLTVLEKEGFRGKFGVVLGAVHMTFCKEIKPYQSYSVGSQIVGWDRKWLIIESSFWRADKKDHDGSNSKVLLSKAVSKFVFKKGRITIAPERVFRAAGLIEEPSSLLSTLRGPQNAGSGASGFVDNTSTWSESTIESTRAANMEAHNQWLDYSNKIVGTSVRPMQAMSGLKMSHDQMDPKSFETAPRSEAQFGPLRTRIDI